MKVTNEILLETPIQTTKPYHSHKYSSVKTVERPINDYPTSSSVPPHYIETPTHRCEHPQISPRPPNQKQPKPHQKNRRLPFSKTPPNPVPPRRLHAQIVVTWTTTASCTDTTIKIYRCFSIQNPPCFPYPSGCGHPSRGRRSVFRARRHAAASSRAA